MPFLRRVFFHPSVANRAPLRDALVDSVQQRRAAGERASFFARLFPPSGIELCLVDIWDDLGSFEQWRDSGALTSPRSAVPKLDAMGEQPSRIEMYETFPPPGGPPPSARYFRVGGYRAAAGKAGELRRVLQDWVKAQHAAGHAYGLWEQVAPEQGTMFRTVLGYPDLATFEKLRAHMIGGGATTLGQDIAPLIHEPGPVELWENLTPQ